MLEDWQKRPYRHCPVIQVYRAVRSPGPQPRQVYRLGQALRRLALATSTHEPLSCSVVLTQLAKRALERAGVSANRPGSHVFRHTVATRMVCNGSTFKQIADVLGYQSLASTTVYAKLNLPALAQVALPRPGGER